jgi:heat shock protein HslJ
MRDSAVSRYGGRSRLDTIALIICTLSAQGCALSTSAPPLPPPTLTQIEDTTFSGILEHPITLENGSYAGAPFVEGGASGPAVQLWSDLIAFGDLDRTPGDEAAVLLSSTAGGSGERVHLAAVGTRDGQVTELGSILVGDRVKVRSLSVIAGEVSIDVVEAGPGDAACCPTQLARKTYVLDEGTLRLESSVGEGVLSLEALSGTWRLTWIDQEAPPAEVKTPTLELRGLRLAGYSGCNHYTGSFEELGPGKVKVAPLAGTRMACAPANMNLEQEYLRRLERVDRYTFLAGKLALSGPRGDSEFLLLFDRQAPAKPAE